jgi:hypothetical protein
LIARLLAWWRRRREIRRLQGLLVTGRMEDMPQVQEQLRRLRERRD